MAFFNKERGHQFDLWVWETWEGLKGGKEKVKCYTYILIKVKM